MQQFSGAQQERLPLSLGYLQPIVVKRRNRSGYCHGAFQEAAALSPFDRAIEVAGKPKFQVESKSSDVGSGISANLDSLLRRCWRVFSMASECLLNRWSEMRLDLSGKTVLFWGDFGA